MMKTKVLKDFLSLPNTLVQKVQKGNIIANFHILYVASKIPLTWMGTPVLKNPMDLWTYQEIIFEKKPDVIVETGTAYGGSALYFASLLDLIGKGKVITVDVEQKFYLLQHPRIQFIKGSSTNRDVIAKIKKQLRPSDKVMVVLDSNHHKTHVLEELRIYGEMASPGQYMVVEDSDYNGHPIEPNFGAGPLEAVEEFLVGNSSFRVDKTREKFLFTFNPKGFLIKR